MPAVTKVSLEARISMTHVEGHAVAEIITEKLSESVLHINYKTGPCRFCKNGIPKLLADGQKLWVVFPDGIGFFTSSGWFQQ